MAVLLSCQETLRNGHTAFRAVNLGHIRVVSLDIPDMECNDASDNVDNYKLHLCEAGITSCIDIGNVREDAVKIYNTIVKAYRLCDARLDILLTIHITKSGKYTVKVSGDDAYRLRYS